MSLLCTHKHHHRHHCIVQAEINEKMRSILIDWLVEVHLKFKVRSCTAWELHLLQQRNTIFSSRPFAHLKPSCSSYKFNAPPRPLKTPSTLNPKSPQLMPETLYLSANIIDRYLAKRNVTRKRLQLVGVTAMLIASKYEEIWAPEVRDFVYISDKAYSREDILGCEKTMLEVRALLLFGGGGRGGSVLC